ncbi:MAG: 7-cyano-7-deazaguanine synthase [Bacteroidetes bacterium]|nr:7-cyano-7-deazaguanine synthase [Bacteroidota bacterium]
MKALLLSGGLDSTAIAYWFKEELQFAITVNYGQKSADAEIAASSKICKTLNLHHEIIEVDCRKLGTGNMVDSDAGLDFSPMLEWWPYRNQFLVTIACMKIIKLGINELIIGSIKSDGNHVDGTKEFYIELNRLVSMQEGNLQIRTPAIELTSVELIKKTKIPDSILFWAHSCHTSNTPCGECNGCKKYMYTMQQLGFD